MSTPFRHPDQEIIRTDGRYCFRPNQVVLHLRRMVNLNDLAEMNFPPADWEQFLQLIGYSVSRFCEIESLRHKTKDKARATVERMEAQRRMKKHLRRQQRKEPHVPT